MHRSLRRTIHIPKLSAGRAKNVLQIISTGTGDKRLSDNCTIGAELSVNLFTNISLLTLVYTLILQIFVWRVFPTIAVMLLMHG